jgi:CheY-like chemotaxis protein
LLKRIQAAPALANVPCVAMTAYHDEQVEKAALAAGFHGFFSKPLPKSFGDDIERLLLELKP